MGGMGLIFTPVLVRHPLGPPGLYGPMTSSSRTHSYSKQSHWKEWPTLASHPPPPPPAHPLIHAIRDITVVVKKVAENPAVLAGY